MNEIRVPFKVVKFWDTLETTDSQDERCNTSVLITRTLFCGLEDGRVYQSVKVPCTPGEDPNEPLANYTRTWIEHTPAVPDR